MWVAFLWLNWLLRKVINLFQRLGQAWQNTWNTVFDFLRIFPEKLRQIFVLLPLVFVIVLVIILRAPRFFEMLTQEPFHKLSECKIGPINIHILGPKTVIPEQEQSLIFVLENQSTDRKQYITVSLVTTEGAVNFLSGNKIDEILEPFEVTMKTIPFQLLQYKSVDVSVYVSVEGRAIICSKNLLIPLHKMYQWQILFARIPDFVNIAVQFIGYAVSLLVAFSVFFGKVTTLFERVKTLFVNGARTQ